MNLEVSSDPTHNQEKDFTLSNLHELRKQNPLRVITGQVNINSIRKHLNLIISETKIEKTFYRRTTLH